ncbi:MAG: SGNH/GDSL hydrolase family protein [bacterium]|nr:MAG: SGNH/GDSL hydrolase family protein [bacterium]
MSDMNEKTHRSAKIMRFWFGMALTAVTCVIAFAVAEAVLRLVPIPGITYHSFYYDELTGQRLYPGSTVIYRNDRNDHIRRRVNSLGYLGREHEIAKAPGAIRICFFGDSFTEARQVPLEETFSSIIEHELNARHPRAPIECIAIGMMGYSTLQAYLEYTRWADSLSVDHAVYVFCENDMGDNIPELKRCDAIPFPRLSGNVLSMDFSFRERKRHKTRFPHRTWQYLKSHSLVFSTLESRLKLLYHRGIKLRVTREEIEMAERAPNDEPPEVNALPSTWPDSLRTHAMTVAEMILAKWHHEVTSDGRRFTIIYIPRSSEFGKPLETQDSWAPWLFRFCKRSGIELVDPTPSMIERKNRGEEIYYDHLARAGHEALAASFLKQY